MTLRSVFLALLVSAAASASDRSGGYSISARALLPSTVQVQSAPAGSVIDKVQVKVFSRAGALLSTVNRDGNGTASLAITGLALAAGETVQVQANVRDARIAARNGVCTASALVDSVTASVGTAGGTLTAPDGAALQIPYGALDSAVTITISATSLAPPAGIGAVSPVYQFDPMGTLFAKPVTLSLPLPPGVSDGSIYCTSLSSGAFTPIGGTLVNGVITVLTSQTPSLGQCVIGAKVNVRTVTGVGVVTWLSATTRVSVPKDFAAIGVEAVLADGTHLAGVAGSGAALGTFTIANVPLGEYMLHSGKQYLVTATSTPDLGEVRGGRPIDQRQALTQSTILNLSVTGMKSFDPNGWLEFYSTEADDWDFNTDLFGNVNPGDTSAQLAIDLTRLDASTGFAIQPSLGDHALIAQLTTEQSSTGVPYLAMTRAAPIPLSSDLTDGLAESASVNLADVSLSNSLSVDYRGTQFVNAIHQDGNPNSSFSCPATGSCGGFVAVLAQAADAQDGFYDANADPLIMNDYAPAGTNVVTGAMPYGTPADTTLPGNWGLIFDARWTARLFIPPLPGSRGLGGGGGTGVGFPDGIEWVTSPATAQAAGIIGPPLTLPRNSAVGGVSFYSGGQNVGTSPTLSWSAPSVGAPVFYTINVRQLFVNKNNLRTAARVVANIVTPEKSFTIPAGILQAGSGYLFTLGAVQPTSAGGAGLASAPFKTSIDVASSFTTSNVFWVTSAPPPNPMVATTVQANQSFPWGLSATSSAIYWAERVDNPWDGSPDTGQGRIWTAGLDGSSPHVIVSGQHDPMGIAADGGAVYWTNQGNGGTVMKLNLASNAVSTIATGQGFVGTGILDVNGSLFWAGQGLQALYAGASAPTFLAWDGAVHLASDGANLFGTDYGASPPGATGQVWKRPLTGGAPVLLAQNQPQAWDVQVQGGYVYWSDQAWQQPNLATLHRTPIGGGADQVLFTGNELLKDFAVDAQYVYFTNHGILWGVPVAGGAAVFLALLPNGDPGCPQGDMAVQGKSVYWTDTCSQSVIRATWR